MKIKNVRSFYILFVAVGIIFMFNSICFAGMDKNNMVEIHQTQANFDQIDIVKLNAEEKVEVSDQIDEDVPQFKDISCLTDLQNFEQLSEISTDQNTITGREKFELDSSYVTRLENSLLRGDAVTNINNPLSKPQIYLNTTTSDYITFQNEQKIYYLNMQSTGKLTTKLLVPYNKENPNANYDLGVFKVNSDNSLTTVIVSNYSPIFADLFKDMEKDTDMLREQSSAILAAGDYYVVVFGANGFDQRNPYKLSLTLSSKYDSQEANDNINISSNIQIPSPASIAFSGTLDNADDFDFYKITPQEQGMHYFEFSNIAGMNTYKMYIYEKTGSDFYSYQTKQNPFISENKSFQLMMNPNSTYYIRVAANSYYGSDNGYKVKIRKQIAKLDITSIYSNTCAPPVYLSAKRTNQFGGGSLGYFVVMDRAYVRGVAIDAEGHPVPDASIKVQFDCSNSVVSSRYVYGTTNNLGQFDILIDLPIPESPSQLNYMGYKFKYNFAQFTVYDQMSGKGDYETVVHMKSIR